MAKRSLKPELSALEQDLLETFLAGHHMYRPDLLYPESHSDMYGGLRALIKRFDIKPRPIPLDWADMYPDSQERHKDLAHSPNVVSADEGNQLAMTDDLKAVLSIPIFERRESPSSAPVVRFIPISPNDLPRDPFRYLSDPPRLPGERKDPCLADE